MDNTGAILFLYAESPLHAGSGAGLGAVDLPIQRERMSNLPMIQGSGIKGALRAQLAMGMDGDARAALFGPQPPGAEADSSPANEYAGALALVDGRLLLFPVRTVWGGWAWITSPMILQRLARDLELLGFAHDDLTNAAAAWFQDMGDAQDRVLVTQKSAVARDDRLLIEDLDYEAKAHATVDALAVWLQGNAMPETEGYRPFAERLPGQLAVVSDADLCFLTEHATEVVTRTRIAPETGTVAPGALWTEESLPAETLLWSTAFVSDSRRPNGATKHKLNAADELRDELVRAARSRPRIRLGGDRAVGRGLVGLRVFGQLSDVGEEASRERHR